MKTKVLLMFCVILIAGCTNQTPKPLTDEEKAVIIKEVTDANKVSIDALNKIDFPTFKNGFLDSPYFLRVSIDGRILNFEQAMSEEKGFFESASNIQAVILNEVDKILEKDLVVSTLLLNTNMTLKTGEKGTFEKLEVTNILRKIDNQWKSVFYQESGLPPTVAQPEKK
jgi:PBP1b-binding outer membrane lipoprotein LpoB